MAGGKMRKRRRMRLAYKHSECPNRTTRPPPPHWLRHGRVIEYAKYNLRIGYCYWTKLYWATPPWLTQEMLNEIEQIYLNATDEEHVDHIVPLKGYNVCGLHVPWNLKAIPIKENYAKSNHTYPDMWNVQLTLNL